MNFRFDPGLYMMLQIVELVKILNLIMIPCVMCIIACAYFVDVSVVYP